MSNQDDLPYWSQGRLAPEQEQVIDDQYRAFTETREVARGTAGPAPGEPLLQGGGHSTARAPEPPKSRWPRRLGMGLFGLLGIAALVGIGYWFAQTELGTSVATGDEANPSSPTLAAETVDEETAEELTTAEDESDEASSDADGEDAGDDATTSDGDAADDTSDTESDDTAATDDSTDDASLATSGSDRVAVLKSGKLYLRGTVPSQDVSDFIAGKAAAVVGPDNVVVEYTIDETAVIEEGDSAPLYVEDVVLFEFNSTAVSKDFLPLLDLGVVLLRQNPQASVTVITHTDSVGSAEVNLDVATKRADAVASYWLKQGVEESQIKTDPRGESEAVDDVDDSTAQLQRRAEFIITGLLDT